MDTQPITPITLGMASDGSDEVTNAIDPTAGGHQYLGQLPSVLIIMSTVVLSLLAILLNLGVVSFYRKQIKSLVPFIYSILAGSDLCTGVCTGLHSIVFVVLLIVKNENSLLLYWLSFLTYFTTLVTFRLSAFVSLTFSVIRTINILSPFKRIRKRAVCIAIAIYLAILVTMSLVEIGLLKDWQRGQKSRRFMTDHFFRPGSLNSLFHRTSELVDESKLVNFCSISGVSTLPILLPALLALAATLVQIYVLLTPKKINMGQKETENTKKKVSITIAIISSLFFICSIFMIALPLTSCVKGLKGMDLSEKGLLLYLSMYIPMFLNAALNPLILTIRGEQLNEYIRSKVGMRRRGLEGDECSMRNLGNGLGGGKARPERISVDTINTQASVNIA